MGAQIQRGVAAAAVAFADVDALAVHLLDAAKGLALDLMPQRVQTAPGGPRVDALSVFALGFAFGRPVDLWLGWALGDGADPAALRAALNRTAPMDRAA